MPDNSANNAFGQQNTASAAYNGGDYYQMMPANAHDYLGGGEVLPSAGDNNLLRHPQAPPELPGVPGMPPINPLLQPTSDPTVGKMPVGTSAANGGIKLVEQGMQNMGLGALGAEQLKHPMQPAIGIPGGAVTVPQSVVSQNSVIPGSVQVQGGPPLNPGGSSSPLTGGGNSTGGSNAPKPVSWAAIASKPAKPQPKPKVKVPGPGLPPPVKHNPSDIGNWDETQQGGKGGNVARGSMPGQPNMPQRWSSPRQGGNNNAG